MISKPDARGAPETKAFKPILIQKKNENLKTLRISKFTVLLIVILNIGLLAVTAVFILNYNNLKRDYEYSLKNNQELMGIKETQQQEITELKKGAEEIKSKLIELKDLEQKLKDRLNISSSLSTVSTVSRDSSVSRSSSISRAAYLNRASTDNQLKNIDDQIASINNSLELADKKIAYIKTKPSILPAEGRISSNYGKRSNPFTEKGYEFHKGVDIANSYGTILQASADGVIKYSGWKSGFGYAVYIDHGNGYVSIYGHCSKLLVKEGQKVERGQSIAQMGSTGRATGNHVHFEIRLNGVAVNPVNVLNEAV